MPATDFNTVFEDNHKADVWPNFDRSHYGVLEALKGVIETQTPVEIVNWIAPQLNGMREMEHVWASLMVSGDERLEKVGVLCKLIFEAQALIGTAEFNQRDAAEGGRKICVDSEWPEPDFCFHTNPHESLAKAEKAKEEAIPLVMNVLIAGVSSGVLTDIWGDKALVGDIFEKATGLVSQASQD